MPWSIASHGDVKADYELVKQIGTKRAWEVFLGAYSTGFYAELAGAQIEALNNQPSTGPQIRTQVRTPFRIPLRAGPWRRCRRNRPRPAAKAPRRKRSSGTR